MLHHDLSRDILITTTATMAEHHTILSPELRPVLHERAKVAIDEASQLLWNNADPLDHIDSPQDVRETAFRFRMGIEDGHRSCTSMGRWLYDMMIKELGPASWLEAFSCSH